MAMPNWKHVGAFGRLSLIGSRENIDMLRRTMPILLVLMMLTSLFASADASAPPEPREETITVEGMEERIATVRFERPRGYAFWYDPECLRPMEPGEGNDIDDFAPPGADYGEFCPSIQYSGHWITRLSGPWPPDASWL